MSSIAVADAVHQCAHVKATKCVGRAVRHDGLESIDLKYYQLRQTLEDGDFFSPLAKSVRGAGRVLWALRETPLPFNTLYRRFDGLLADIHNDGSNVPSEHQRERVLALSSSISQLLMLEVDPFGDMAREVLAETAADSAVLVPSAREIDNISARLPAAAAVLSPHSLLRADRTWQRLVVIGMPAWYDRNVLRSPHAHSLCFIYPEWLTAHPIDLTRLEGAPARILSIPENDEARKHRGSTPPRETVTHPKPPALLPPKIIPRGGTAALRVEARLARLASGNYVYLEANGTVDGLTEDDIQALHAGTLVWRGSMRVADLREGDYVVIRERGEPNYVAPIADLILGESAGALRADQRLWSDHLHRLSQMRTPERISRELMSLGAKYASPANVARWAGGDPPIRPLADADCLAISSHLGSAEPRLQDDDYWGGLSKVQNAHKQAGQIVRKRLQQELAAKDPAILIDDGWVVCQLEEMEGEGALRIERVLDLFGDTCAVERSYCRTLVPGRTDVH